MEACDASPDGSCLVVRDLGSKFGTYLVVDTDSAATSGGREEGSGDETDDATDDEAGETGGHGGPGSTQPMTEAMTQMADRALPPGRGISGRKARLIERGGSLVLTSLSVSSSPEDDRIGMQTELIMLGQNGSTLKISRVHLQFCLSRIESTAKRRVNDLAGRVGALLTSGWDPRTTTHLITDRRISTAKSISAWACGRPIVTPAYVDALLRRGSHSDPIPDESNFRPPGSLVMDKMDPQPLVEERKCLKGFHVVSLTEHEAEALAASAGATIVPAHSMNENSFKGLKWLKDLEKRQADGEISLVVIETTSKKAKIRMDFLRKKCGLKVCTMKELAASISEIRRSLVGTDGKRIDSPKSPEEGVDGIGVVGEVVDAMSPIPEGTNEDGTERSGSISGRSRSLPHGDSVAPIAMLEEGRVAEASPAVASARSPSGRLMRGGGNANGVAIESKGFVSENVAPVTPVVPPPPIGSDGRRVGVAVDNGRVSPTLGGRSTRKRGRGTVDVAVEAATNQALTAEGVSRTRSKKLSDPERAVDENLTEGVGTAGALQTPEVGAAEDEGDDELYRPERKKRRHSFQRTEPGPHVTGSGQSDERAQEEEGSEVVPQLVPSPNLEVAVNAGIVEAHEEATAHRVNMKRKHLPKTADGWLLAAPQSARERGAYRSTVAEIDIDAGSEEDVAAVTERRSNLVVRNNAEVRELQRLQRSVQRRDGRKGRAVRDFKQFRKNVVICGSDLLETHIRLRSVLPKETERQRQLDITQRELEREQQAADALFNEGGSRDHFKRGSARKVGGRRRM